MRFLVQFLLAALLAQPVLAAIVRVQKADAYPGNSVTFTGTTPGNFLMIAASWSDTTSDPTISDSALNTWNALPVLRGPAGQGAVSVKMFYAMNITGGNTTISLSSSPTDVGIHAVEYSGVSTSNALDVTNTAVAAGGTTTPTSGSFPPTVAGDLVYVYFGDEGTAQSTITAGAGYAIVTATGNHADASEDDLAAASGTQTASFTLGATTSSWAIYVAAFKAASGSALLCSQIDDGLIHPPRYYSCDTPPCAQPGSSGTPPPLVPPAVGGTYTDPQYNCTVKRMSAFGDALPGAGNHHYYSTITPTSAADSYLMAYLPTGGSTYIRNVADGSIRVTPGNFPTITGHITPWDRQIDNRFYFTNGNQLFKGDVQTGSCSPNCSVTISLEYTFTGTGLPAGCCSTVMLPDQTDVTDDNTKVWLIGDPGTECAGTAILYNYATHTIVSSSLTLTSCHKIQTFPSGKLYCTNCNGNVETIYNTDGSIFWNLPWSSSAHGDVGTDLAGREVLIHAAQGLSQYSACSDLWFGINAIDINTQQPVSCIYNGKAQYHFSYRDSAQGWVVITTFDASTCSTSTDPRYSCFDTTTPSRLASNWATIWDYGYEEVILAKVDGSAVYRLAHHRSRSAEGYWAEPHGVISIDGKYVVWDSNFDISNTGDANYGDIYLIQVRP